MATPRQNNFSIIIPTYTGEEHIEECFKSILEQEPKQQNYEVVAVVDGPSKSLRKKVDEAASAFRARNIELKVHQFTKNRGRFYARYKGAEIASYNQLLFVDDRVMLDKHFMREVAAAGTDTLMPNVLETAQPNILSRLSYLFRRRIYGKKMWGSSFEPYYVSVSNFEKAPKGTAGLWVSKDIFIEACRRVEAEAGKGADLRNSSDDTKLLREIVKNKQILKSSAAVIYYNPRAKFTAEARHIYQRGPKFVDYYLKKGSRFRPHLLASIAGVLAAVAGIVLWRWPFVLGLVGVGVVGLVILSLLLTEKPRDLWTVWAGLPLAALLFGAGVAKGMTVIAYARLAHRYN